MKKARKFLTLSPVERRLLKDAAFVLGSVRLGLWLLPFQTVQRTLGRLLRRRTPGRLTAPAVPSSDRIAWAIGVASRWIPLCTCLVQAVATHHLLTRYGRRSTLYIGVAKKKGLPPEGHAWVECAGEIVVGEVDNLPRFGKLLSFEGGASLPCRR